MYPPYWDHSSRWGWQLAEPILMQGIGGEVQVGTSYLGIWVRNATIHYDDCTPRSKRFRNTEEAKAYALSTYLLMAITE
jgi:hypothetical protein